MARTKSSHYQEILTILSDLKTTFPSYSMGRHLSTALFEYGDIWGLSDKEVLFALKKYRAQIQMDIPHTEGEVDQIISDGMDLKNILNNYDEEDNYFI
jgi:hypothetical protein